MNIAWQPVRSAVHFAAGKSVKGPREASEPADSIFLSALPRIVPARLARSGDEAARLASGPALFGLGGILLPDSTGRIAHMALQFGNTEFDRPLPEHVRTAVLRVWDVLFREMDPRTRFTVVAADERNTDDAQALAQRCGVADRVEVVNARSQKGMSIWIRDSMLPVRTDSGDTRLLIQSRTYWPGPEDQLGPELLGWAAGRSVHAAPHDGLRIDGGNVVSNRRELVVGIDSVRQTADRLGELGPSKDLLERFLKAAGGGSWEDLPVRLFENEFGKKALVVGQDDPATPDIVEEQPAFHVDMFATPIGDRKFLVGDPGMAIATLQKLTPDERVRVNQEMVREAGLEPGRDLVGDLIDANNSREEQANFDNVARQLAAAGYEVERVPCLLGKRFTHSLPYLTYNNCMMEEYEGTRKVYLPVYGCEPLDAIARQAYEREGFRVVPLPMAAISVYEGAIRCSSYALRREAS